MKYILLLFITTSILLSAPITKEKEKEVIKNKNIQEQLKLEKKYSKEQRFYQSQEYDLKGAEVDMDSVKNIPDVEDTNADFNMDDSYD